MTGPFNNKACTSTTVLPGSRIVSIFGMVALLAVLFGNSVCFADAVDLRHEFDGNSNGSVVYGTIMLAQNGNDVDFVIVADTSALVGGDIHEFYFNLPDLIDVDTLSISNSGGVSNQSISPFTLLGSGFSVVGGAGASFDGGVNFGNGGGPNGNGTLTTATFTLSAPSGLSAADFLSETTSSSQSPEVHLAVHFQASNVFGAGSETIGGAAAIPEPAAGLGFGLLVGWAGLARRRRR